MMKLLKRGLPVLLTLILLFELVSAPLEWLWPQQWGGTTYWSAETEEKVLALTFDDGPSPYTEKVLDILREHGAHATFFVMGRQVEAYPQLIQRMAREGHEVANHTYDFEAQANKFFSAINLSDIEKTQKLIESLAKKTPVFFRSPGGQMGRSLYNAVRKSNLFIVNGAIPFPHPDYGAEKQLAIARENIRPGAIIILHDGDDHNPASTRPGATVEMLPRLLAEIKKKGYRTEVLSEILKK